MKRRRFLTTLTSIFGLGALVAFVYPILRLITPIKNDVKGKSVIISKHEIPLDDARDFVIGEIPITVINSRNKGYTIFSKVCTHLGCLVKYDKENLILICPCHAGKFDLEGNVISGPPPKPLQKFPFRVEGNSLVIG